MSAEERWQRLISGAATGPLPDLARAGLTLASGLYRLGLRANLAVYDSGLKRQSRAALPVISVGNLTLGGTGKSTAVRYLARELERCGVQPGIVLRGHRRTEGPGVLLASDGRGHVAPLAQMGDEAAEVARALPRTPVAVGRRREQVIAQLAAAGAQVALLDDGFQYFRMARDLDIVLVSARVDVEGARLFPRGLLREPWSHLARADQIWITHADQVSENLVAQVRGLIERWAPAKPVVVARHAPAALTALGGEPLSLDALRGQSVLALSGLGCPESFEYTLGVLGATVTPLRYEDHHRYTPADWARIGEAATGHEARAIVTTEKDAVKLPSDAPLPVWVLRSEMSLLEGEATVAGALADICHLIQG